jgi:hypothetical protein
MKHEDARLLRRLADVGKAMGPVVLLLLEHWRNDMDGGLPPADDLRRVGKDFVELGGDLIARADEVDQGVSTQSEEEQ